jgi:hypothetical protein
VRPPVVFVATSLSKRWQDIASLDAGSVEREPGRFRIGMDNWIVQTYLRLREALEARGHAVRIGERFERDAICVAHRDDLNRFGDPLYDCFVIGARADRPPIFVADVEVVQNRLEMEPRSRFIPHWPQPNLLHRDEARGDRFENVAYLGRTDSVPAWYSAASFTSELAAMGITLEVRNDRWHDCRSVDAVLAHRDESAVMLRTKPASKLVNAWLAHVPAVMAPEPAFEELRRSPHDYLAAADAEATLRALRTLRSEPQLRAAMVENGKARARDFDLAAVTKLWLDLFEESAEGYPAWRASRGAWPTRYVRHVRALSAQKARARAFRARERREKRQAS